MLARSRFGAAQTSQASFAANFWLCVPLLHAAAGLMDRRANCLGGALSRSARCAGDATVGRGRPAAIYNGGFAQLSGNAVATRRARARCGQGDVCARGVSQKRWMHPSASLLLEGRRAAWPQRAVSPQFASCSASMCVRFRPARSTRNRPRSSPRRGSPNQPGAATQCWPASSVNSGNVPSSAQGPASARPSVWQVVRAPRGCRVSVAAAVWRGEASKGR